MKITHFCTKEEDNKNMEFLCSGKCLTGLRDTAYINVFSVYQAAVINLEVKFDVFALKSFEEFYSFLKLVFKKASCFVSLSSL